MRSHRRKNRPSFLIILRRCGLAAAALLCFAGFAAPGSADDEPVKATITATVNDGYARLIFDMSQYDDASVRLANNVLVITFKRSIDVSVDRLASQISRLCRCGAARSRRQGHSRGAVAAGEGQCHAGRREIFIDLLPTSWSGQPPGLPPEVIADLARRAREADRLERKDRQAVAQQRRDCHAGARACGDAADFHPLHLRHPGQHRHVTERSDDNTAMSFAIEHGGEAIGGIGFKLGVDIARLSLEMGYWLGEPFWDAALPAAP